MLVSTPSTSTPGRRPGPPPAAWRSDGRRPSGRSWSPRRRSRRRPECWPAASHRRTLTAPAPPRGMKSRSPASMAPKGAAKPLLRLRATLSAWCATSLPVTPEKGGGVEQTGAVEMNGQGSFLREVVDSPHRRERHHGAPRIDVRVLRDDQRGARTLFVALSNGTLQIRDVRHAAPPGHGDRHGPGHRRHGPPTRRRSHGSLPRRRSSRRDDRKYERLFDCKACTWGRRGRSPSRACRPPTPPGDRRWGPPSGRTRKGIAPPPPSPRSSLPLGD